MNNTLTLQNRDPRGRKQSQNSLRMSQAIYRARVIEGKKLMEIAESYNKQKRFAAQGRHFTVQAIKGRITSFVATHPDLALQIQNEVASTVEV